MSALIIWGIVFILSLAALVKASDYFTQSAEKIGLFLGISSFIVGVTIVSIGTSFPELISSVFAVLRGAPEIVTGNVFGSNITNIFLILGVSAIVGRKLVIDRELIHVDLPFLVGATFLLVATVYDGVFSVFEAILCLVVFVVYITYTVYTSKKREDVHLKKTVKAKLKSNKKKFDWNNFLVLVLSLVFIYLGARYTVESVIELSKILNIGVEIIAASAIALGTSLPELAVSIAAIRRKNAEIAVGNILGSNIFNALAVMGVPALVGAIVIPAKILTFGISFLLIGVLMIATLLYFFITQDKEITRWEGWLLVVFYVFFIGALFGWI